VHDLNNKTAVADSGIPLFYLGGDPAFRPLARSLGAVHPFQSLAIEASVILQSKNPYSLRCIAEQFAKAIRERRPQGPYMLGGWCAHGVLALETAQILREQGQDIALLVLLETINPENLRRQRRLVQTLATLQRKLNLFGFEYKYLRSLGENHAKQYVSKRFASNVKSPHTGVRPSRSAKENQQKRSTPLEILYTAVGNYLPRPYDSPVLLIRTHRGVFGVRGDRDLGWGKTLGKLEICETGGNHYTMYVEPNVEGLVQKVSACLKTAEQRWQRQSA
jgi:thioesterase domain-containing protein